MLDDDQDKINEYINGYPQPIHPLTVGFSTVVFCHFWSCPILLFDWETDDFIILLSIVSLILKVPQHTYLSSSLPEIIFISFITIILFYWEGEKPWLTLEGSGLSDDDDPPSFPQLRGFKLGRNDILDDDPLLLFSLEETLPRLERLPDEDFKLVSELSSLLLPFLAGRLGGFFRFNTSLSLLQEEMKHLCLSV